MSGVEPKHIKNAPSFESVVKAVSDITAGRIVVGHALKNDLHALMLKHPKHLVRDTSKYPPFRRRHGVSPAAPPLTAAPAHRRLRSPPPPLTAASAHRRLRSPPPPLTAASLAGQH